MSDCHKCMFLYDASGPIVTMCQRYEMAESDNVDDCECFKEGRNYYECMNGKDEK